jgi:UPF0716 protein FxsA
MWAILLIVGIPLLEIGLFVTLGGAIGLFPTLAFVLVSALLGVFLLRRSVAGAAGGRVGPVQKIVSGGFGVISGILLILPGFFSSFLGLTLMVPFVQRALVALAGQRLTGRGFVFHRPTNAEETVIEGEFEELRDQAQTPEVPSKWSKH